MSEVYWVTLGIAQTKIREAWCPNVRYLAEMTIGLKPGFWRPPLGGGRRPQVWIAITRNPKILPYIYTIYIYYIKGVGTYKGERIFLWRPPPRGALQNVQLWQDRFWLLIWPSPKHTQAKCLASEGLEWRAPLRVARRTPHEDFSPECLGVEFLAAAPELASRNSKCLPASLFTIWESGLSEIGELEWPSFAFSKGLNPD